MTLNKKHPHLTDEEIGHHESVQLGRQAVNVRMNAPKFKRALAEINRPAFEILQAHQAAAARELGRQLHDPDVRIRQRAANLLLWSQIHKEEPINTVQDNFVAFIQEAAALAEERKESPAPTKVH